MQRLLWNERWARETVAFVYSFLLFSSQILKILLCLVVVKEQARPMLKYYSLLCTGTGTRRLIYCQNLPHIVIYFYSHHVYEFYWYYQSIAFTNLYFQSTRKDLFAQQESLSLLKIPKLPSIVYILDSHIRFLSNLQISLLHLLFSAV